MGDKEPRRRKKRKDLQSRKDDTRSDDSIFISSKSDVKDSDQEEEEVMTVQQPNVFAKFVFVLLFSGLIVSMSFIFISLHGTERVYDVADDHHDEIEIPQDGFDEHSAEDSHSDDILEEHEDILRGISKFFSFNDEQIPELDHISPDELSFDNLNKSEETDKHAELSEEQSIKEDDFSTIKSPLEDEMQDMEITTSPNEFDDDLISSELYTEAPNAPTEDLDHSHEDFVVVQPSLQHPEEISDESADDFDTSTATEESLNVPSSESVSQNTIESSLNVDILTDNVVKGDFAERSNDREEESVLFYEKADITNEADYILRDELDQLDTILEKSPEKALKRCEDLLHAHSSSPRLHYVKARALDRLAETQRSNKFLESAIAEYQSVMTLKDVPYQLYLIAGKRAADRLRFRGLMGKSLKLLSEMSDKFPNNIEIKNLVAVGFLLIGQNKESKKILQEVLKLDPMSGFAKVHLGFILKTDESNYEEAIQLMREGIASRESGVVDGRFYFQLGDALHRVGKQDEAMKVYEDAVAEGLFLSAYQRSLYNEKGLTAKPWWNPQSTIYSPYFKLLEKNWKSIRDEVLSITNEKQSGFLSEAEGLQEKGEWKQFELFARGRKIEKNCLKVPKTCDLILQIPDAANCKRGQVKFSIMHPSTHVWAHTGPTNCRLRSHLGLVVPDGASIRVANETRHWKEGEILLFDDSFEHEVWHNGNSSRLVLIVDFWHPELTAYQKKSLTPI